MCPDWRIVDTIREQTSLRDDWRVDQDLREVIRASTLIASQLPVPDSGRAFIGRSESNRCHLRAVVARPLQLTLRGKTPGLSKVEGFIDLSAARRYGGQLCFTPAGGPQVGLTEGPVGWPRGRSKVTVHSGQWAAEVVKIAFKVPPPFWHYTGLQRNGAQGGRCGGA